MSHFRVGILLPMQNDPLVQWQELTETYSRMYDQELLNLAADSNDLTETARQVLDGEMRKRGLNTPGAAGAAPSEMDHPQDSELDATAQSSIVDAASGEAAGIKATDQESDSQDEYTWKTNLCECDSRQEAWQIREVLRRAGIESWIEGPGGAYSPYSQLDQRSPRVLVPADRFEEARNLAAKPISKDVVDESEMQPDEFKPPECPKCGAGDAVLEGVDPFNSWKCEACGNQWTESAVNEAPAPESEGQ